MKIDPAQAPGVLTGGRRFLWARLGSLDIETLTLPVLKWPKCF
jgi:hypothetical protein